MRTDIGKKVEKLLKALDKLVADFRDDSKKLLDEIQKLEGEKDEKD